MKRYFFNSKERHEAFRKAFSTATKGSITPVHHMLLNVIRFLPANRGFTPITNKTKLENGWSANWALKWAEYELQRHIRDAKVVIDEDTTPSPKPNYAYKYAKSRTDDFLYPLKGTLTREDLVKISLDTKV